MKPQPHTLRICILYSRAVCCMDRRYGYDTSGENSIMATENDQHQQNNEHNSTNNDKNNNNVYGEW